MEAKKSITETPNELTRNLDLATPVEIARLLRSTDAQIFGGYGGFPGIYDEDIMNILVWIADRAGETLADPKGKIILSGAGTSGRLAVFTVRTFNRLCRDQFGREPFSYTIAGGERALIAAQEGAEDDPKTGAADLVSAAKGASTVLYVGITCGLSAPYVAGQLEAMLDGKVPGHAVLLGFNPADRARNAPIEGWDKTFSDVVVRLLQSSNAKLLNPVVGPEPVTGSTRMKGGSATKILLEAIFHAARAAGGPGEESPEDRQLGILYVLNVILNDFETAIRAAYASMNPLAGLIAKAGDVLKQGGSIYYVGVTGPEEIDPCGDGCDHDHDHEDEENLVMHSEAGILGLIDASECPPTYGAAFDDVRGYILGGWKSLLPGSGIDFSPESPFYQISLDDFRGDKLPSLAAKDLVIGLGEFKERDSLLEDAARRGAATAVITTVHNEEPKADHLIMLQPQLTTLQPEEGGIPEIFDGPVQLSIKLVLNAVTTGAHVLDGKVFGNRMIDMKLSNNKLYHRAIGIICDLAGVPEEQAVEALLKSIYQTDILSSEQAMAPVSLHIEASGAVKKVIPTALLMATGKFSFQQACDTLRHDPVVRHAVEAYVK